MNARTEYFPPSRESFPADRVIQEGIKNDLPFDTVINDIRYFLSVYEQTGDPNALRAAHLVLGSLIQLPLSSSLISNP